MTNHISKHLVVWPFVWNLQAVNFELSQAHVLCIFCARKLCVYRLDGVKSVIVYGFN